MRSLLILILLTVCALPVVGQMQREGFEGRTVVSVIEDFRSQGWSFAYSTNLVSDDLLVIAEPEDSEPLEIVRQILVPHGLTLRSEEGLWLIVRDDASAASLGSLLIIVRDRRDYMPLDDLKIDATPDLERGILLTQGIQQIPEVTADTYLVTVGAAGYRTVEREVRVRPGQNTELKVELDPARPEIENITVSASRYEISRDISTSRFDIDRTSIETLPDLGNDPLRATHRLPGAAASGASARSHFRGGDEAETGIILNGQKLFDPFHVRDYQNIFSTVDSRAIDGVEVYTGGFPVQYGDRLSGVVLMESLELTRPRHTEIGVSVFNTSFLTAGRNADSTSDWLFSARRGNLDLVIDKKFGLPRYYDIFSQFSTWLTPDTRLSGIDVPRSWDQRHSLQAGLTWNVNNWDFSVAGLIRSGWPTTSLALEEIIGPGGAPGFIAIPGPRNAEQLPRFASLDARISRKFDVGRGTITAFVEVSNLLDRNNVCCFDYDLETDENGEEFLESSPDYWLPLLPAVGFLWEF